MNLDQSIHEGLPAVLPAAPDTMRGRIAREISNIFNPLILAVILLILVAMVENAPGAWMYAATTFGMTIVLPVMLILWLLRSGRISDFDIYHRKQRVVPYLAVIALLMLCGYLLQAAGAPQLYIVLMFATLLQAVAMFLINQVWKISAHAATAAIFAVLVYYLLGPAALPCTLVVPLMAWSRVTLRRHTLKQTAAGAILGATVFTLVLTTFA